MKTGTSARAAILAHTKRATAMGIASVSKIMFVGKIIATSSGIWQIQVLIAVSQVNLSLGQKMKTFRVLLTLVLRGDSGGRIRSSRRKHLCWRTLSLRRGLGTVTKNAYIALL